MNTIGKLVAAVNPRHIPQCYSETITSRSMTSLKMILFCVGVGLLCIPAIARAQDSNSNVLFDAPGFLPKKPKPGLPEVKAQPTVWPRLDPGAVFCRTSDDLSRLAARRRGEPVAGPVDCRIVRIPTGISIVERNSGGMIEVKTNDPQAGGVGWTDAWLPNK
jgi:hypothetical protein